MQLQPFTSTPVNGCEQQIPHMWLLLKSVSCYFDSMLGRQEINILDATGSGDHKLCATNALHSRRKCRYSIIVTDFSRAINDASVSSLAHECRDNVDGHLVVAATVSDIIDENTLVDEDGNDRHRMGQLRDPRTSWSRSLSPPSWSKTSFPTTTTTLATRG